MARLTDLALDSFEGQLRLRKESVGGGGDIELDEVTAPGTPAANRVRLYAKDQSAVSALFYKNDAGTEINLSGSLTGTGTANQLAIWSAASVLTGDTDLTFLTDTLTATKISVPTSISLTGTGTLNVAAMTQGSIPFFGAAGLLSQDNTGVFYDDTNNSLILGATSMPDTVPAARGLAVVRSGSQANLNLFSFGNVGLIRAVGAYTARGTVGTPTATQSGDGVVYPLIGYDGSSYQTKARVDLVAAENWSTTAFGTYLSLLTTATGGGSPAITERFRIGPAGQWGIGGATYGTAGQYFRSAGSAAAPTWATIDHGSELAGLTDDDHTQYLLASGTRALAGAWNMASQAITNLNMDSGTIDGATITSPTLAGTLAGTYSIGGTPTLASDLTIASGINLLFLNSASMLRRTADNRLSFAGDFTGSANTRGGIFEGVLTIPVSGLGVGTRYGVDFATAASGIHANIDVLQVAQPSVTSNGATVTRTSILYIENAMTIGTNNYSLFIDAGLPRIDSTATAGAGAGTISTTPNAGGGNPAVWMKLDVNGTSYAFPGWAL